MNFSELFVILTTVVLIGYTSEMYNRMMNDIVDMEATFGKLVDHRNFN